MNAAELQVYRAAYAISKILVSVIILIVIECGVVIPLATAAFYLTVRKASWDRLLSDLAVNELTVPDRTCRSLWMSVSANSASLLPSLPTWSGSWRRERCE